MNIIGWVRVNLIHEESFALCRRNLFLMLHKCLRMNEKLNDFLFYFLQLSINEV